MGSIEAPWLEIPLVGRDTESGNRSTLNSFTLMFQKLRLSSHGKKALKLQLQPRFSKHRETLLIGWFFSRFNAGTTYIEGPQMRRRRASPACHHACMTASRSSIHPACLGEVHTSSTPISSMPESRGSNSQRGPRANQWETAIGTQQGQNITDEFKSEVFCKGKTERYWRHALLACLVAPFWYEDDKCQAVWRFGGSWWADYRRRWVRSNGFCVEKKEWHVPMMKLEVRTHSDPVCGPKWWSQWGVFMHFFSLNCGRLHLPVDGACGKMWPGSLPAD